MCRYSNIKNIGVDTGHRSHIAHDSKLISIIMQSKVIYGTKVPQKITLFNKGRVKFAIMVDLFLQSFSFLFFPFFSFLLRVLSID